MTTNGTSAVETCQHCGCMHFGKTCDRIKAMEYYQDGKLKRVEYHEPRMIDPLPAVPFHPWWVVPPWTCEESSRSSTTLPFDPTRWAEVTMQNRDDGFWIN